MATRMNILIFQSTMASKNRLVTQSTLTQVRKSSLGIIQIGGMTGVLAM